MVLNPYAPEQTAILMNAIAHEGALPIGSPVPYDPFDPPLWPVSYPMSAGGVTLDKTGCNGVASDVKLAPNRADTPATLHVPAGSTQLIRIVNGTSDSGTRLILRDASGQQQPFRVVGLDGVPVSGDMEHPLSRYISMNELMLTAMSRADLLLTTDADPPTHLPPNISAREKIPFLRSVRRY
jgi:hypothetical protein